MALSKTSITSKVRSRLYGSGLGEKPSIVQATGTATVTAPTVAFSLVTGEGASVRKGHVLTAYEPASGAAYGFYIIDVATDVITAINGYIGDTIANAATMPTLLEVNAPISAGEIHDAIDEIIDGYLFPQVFDIDVDSFTPDLSSRQTNANTRDQSILRGWQKLGAEWYQVPIKLIRNVGTSDFASGAFITYDANDASKVYYSVIRKVDLANSTAAGLEGLIAKGATALVAEGASAGALWESARADAQTRSDKTPGQSFWASFNKAKAQYSNMLSKDSALEFRVDRG